MIIVETKTPIVCDMAGCKNTAKYFVKKEEGSNAFYSLKLCEDCAKELFTALKKEFKKGVKDSDKN